MAELEEKNIMETTSLTIGDTTYKTNGNILFSNSDDEDYFLAHSPVLERMDEVLQENFLANGMQSLLKKILP